MVLEISAADGFDGHKVDDLSNSVNGQETCDENIGFWYIELFMSQGR